MPMIRPNRKRDNSPRVRFDKRTALVTGMGAALVLAPDRSIDALQQTSIPPLRSELRAVAFGNQSMTNSRFPGEASALPVLQSRSEEDFWTEAEQKRFQELAVAEAVGSLKAEEVLELEQLTILRRAFHKPRTGDEVLWEFEQRQRTRELLETLRRYVEFYEGEDPAWISAGQSPY
jgi:hypothetical protein